MKIKIYLSLIFLITVFNSFAQTTNNSGNWTDDIWTGGYPTFNLTNSITVNTGHNVIIGSQDANQGLSLDSNNEILLIKGILTINGDLTVKGNKWDIIVSEGAQLIITGSVNFQQNGGGDEAVPELNVTGNGSVTIGGDVNATKGGIVTGDGSIYVDGDISGDVGIDSDVTVVGNAESYCPPSNLRGTVASQGLGYTVTLEWEISAECSPIKFIIKRILGDIVTVDTVGNTKSTTHSYPDTNGLIETSEPIYEVSAVYAAASGHTVASGVETLNYTNNPLPIELLHFTATSSNSEVVLNWATAAEINNDYFTIEKSIDGGSWEVVDYITGAGNSNYMIEYSYTDASASEGISYYRLKQTDYDGQFEYFAPVAVNITKTQPAAEIVNVKISSTSMDVWFQNENENAIIMVADIQGRILAQYNLASEDFVQNVTVNFPRSYSGEVVMVRMVSSDSSVEKKFMVR